MITQEDIKNNKELKLDKSLGALIGQAIGDSFGDASRTDKNHKRYGITMDFDENDSWSTDDTEFSLLTALTLIENKGLLTNEAVKKAWLEYVVPQDEYYRGGASEIEAAMNLKRGLTPPLTGKYNSHYMSDGAAMRIAPVGIICAGDPARAAELAKIDASISHWRDGIWGAQAVAAAVSIAMVNGSVEEIIDAARQVIPEDSWFRYTFEKALNIVEESDSLESAWTPLHTELWTKYKAAVPEAISQAFALFKLSKGNFKKGVIYAGNFGRDADTIGAVVGALNGAINGADKIPERWKEKTRFPTGTCLEFTSSLDLIEVAKDLSVLI